MSMLVVWSQEDSQLYRAQGMHSLLEELNIEHGYRELEGVGHESGRIYPFSAMVSVTTWPCPVPVVDSRVERFCGLNAIQCSCCCWWSSVSD